MGKATEKTATVGIGSVAHWSGRKIGRRAEIKAQHNRFIRTIGRCGMVRAGGR